MSRADDTAARIWQRVEHELRDEEFPKRIPTRWADIASFEIGLALAAALLEQKERLDGGR